MKLNYQPTPDNVSFQTFKGYNTTLSSTASSYKIEHIIKEYTPISDQLQTMSCVANAAADALEILTGLKDPSNVTQLSRMFVYYNARNLGGNSNMNEGCYIHNAFQSLKTLGICSEELWPFEEKNIYLQPNLLAYKQAYDNRITGAYRITSSGQSRLDDIVMSLDLNTPVIFGTGVSKEFTEAFNVDKVWTTPNVSIGGHAMIITGYRKDNGLKFYIRNSWSNSWGINGHTWFDANYILSNYTNDIWVATNMDNLILE